MCNFSFALAFRPVWLKSRENLFWKTLITNWFQKRAVRTK
jgi:hypothetical protein